MVRIIAFDHAELSGLPMLPRTKGCDFCATGDRQRWRYPARNVELGAVVYGGTVLRPVSIGGWCACQDCSDLIEGGDWPALGRRSLRSLGLDLSQTGRSTRVKMLAALHASHEQFRKARNGPREAVS